MQGKLPIWIGVGVTPQSVVRAGLVGLPLMVAVVDVCLNRFRPMVDAYRKAG